MLRRFLQSAVVRSASNPIHSFIHLLHSHSLTTLTMARSLALLAGALATVVAQTTTVEFLLPMFDPQPLEGSVVAVKDGATTLAIHCPDPKATNCGLASTSTIVGGPSTIEYSYTMHPDVDGFGGGEM